jgi:glutathione S-transferase
MVKLIVYGNKISTCTQRILILLEELQLKYDFIDIDIFNGKQQSESFLNPFGKVPVIEYGEHIIFESRSILRYIAKNNTDDSDLTLNENVNVDMWLETESQNFNPHISKIIYEKLFTKLLKKDTDEKIVETELQKFLLILSIYEQQLSKHKYIASDDFSIADISHIPCIYYFIKCGYKSTLKEFPNVYKWTKRLLSRDSTKTILEE